VKPLRKAIFNCGVSHVSASVFSQGEDEILTLLESGVETLRYDYSDDNLWLDAVVEGLGKLTAKLNLKGEAYMILPGSLLLTKTIRAPRVEEGKQRQIVAFELQQKMPYPLAELIWDYQVVEDDGVEQEVLAIAVRPTIAESFCEKVSSLGLNPVELSAASILDFNALRHSHIEMEGEETLVINVGAKSTNLLFINPEGFLIRNIALGGNSLTQHVADNLGAPFAKAEEVKKTFFSGEVAFAADDPAVQVLEKNAEQFKDRMSQEVTRSVVTYKRLKKGKSPTRVFLCGKGSLLPGLPEHLSQTQSLAVDYFDPLRSVQLGPQIDEELKPQLPFVLSEVIGEACRLFASPEKAKSYRGINLLPKNKLASMAMRKKRWWLAAAAGIAALSPLPGLLVSGGHLEKTQERVERLEDLLDEKQLEVEDQEGKLEEYLAFDHLAGAMQKDLIPLTEVSRGIDNWRLLLGDIQSRIFDEKVGEVWLDELYVERADAQTAGNRGRRSGAPRNKQSVQVVRKLIINGRFLVRDANETEGADEENNSPEDESEPEVKSRDELIELNRRRQAALTESLEKCAFVGEITEKKFETTGKGDLFNRFYTYFHYEISLREGLNL